MFRSLATRLVASYVFAAIVLVLIVGVAVTAFALSTFALGSRETIATVARDAPEEVRVQIARHGSLSAGAQDVVAHLVRPGVRVAVATRLADGEYVVAFGGISEDGRPYAHARPPDMGPPEIRVPEPIPTNFSFGGLPPGLPTDPRAFGPPPRFLYVPGPLPPEPGLGGGFERRGRFDVHEPPFPFALNRFLRLEPSKVAVSGGWVAIIPDPLPLSRAITSFWVSILPIGFFVVLAAWLLGRYITLQALRPLVETTEALNRFAAGDFTPRPIVATDRNEIGELVSAYNGAVAQVSAAFEERRNVEQQMRQFVADAGHELRTPLTVVMGFIDVLRRRGTVEPASSAKIFETMLFESRRMRTLIDKLILLARMENVQARRLEPVDLRAVAERIVLAQQALQPSAHIALRGVPNAVVRGDEDELHEAISNLVDNALKYAPASPVEVEVRGESGDVLVTVADRGPGLGERDRERIFDRFYRGEHGSGTEGFGLGLAIVKRAVARAGGTVALESRPGEGARFTLRIPREPHGEETALAV